MNHIFIKNWDKIKYVIFGVIILLTLILLTFSYKNKEVITNIEKNLHYESQDLILIKEFLFKKIKSPFVNINYEVKMGDSIQKILKKFKIGDNEIGIIINQYKII